MYEGEQEPYRGEPIAEGVDYISDKRDAPVIIHDGDRTIAVEKRLANDSLPARISPV
jgi:hypothetical protein